MGRYDSKKVEKDVLGFWKAKDIYKKAKKSREGAKPFYFMDGPPYATASIHLGTAWNKCLKDTYIRLWRMKGFDVWDQPGFDTHGTPIEVQVEKKLGFKQKQDIEKFGMKKFIDMCKEFATKNRGTMSEQFANLGVWMDWENPYLTLNNSYIEGTWHTFKKAFDAKLLYKGSYPVHTCPRCATVVAYNEIEYTKQTDMSIYVKLKAKDNRFLIIWTTTPWTIPGNTGVMAHPTETYVEAEIQGEKWIIAKARLNELMKAMEAGYKVLREFPGKDLEGLEYEGPLKGKLKLGKLKNAYRVVLSDKYVAMDSGTGLVHTAPGYGKEDFEVGKEAGLPIVCLVGIDGKMDYRAGKYEGKKAREVDGEIINDLIESGELAYKHPYTHDYPICWRCKTPLLQINVPQWFFKVTAIRDNLLKENEKIKWFPDWAGTRFKDWLENLGDWPISRQRFWGTPLPIWTCKECASIEVIGSFKELQEKSGLKKEIDFHKPEIDEVKWKCKCGGKMKRVPDVMDVWFDAGSSGWASLGYPRNKELFEKFWPIKMELEGPDQFRGWWNSQMILTYLTFGELPFKRCLLHGMAMDLKGAKMSKSQGNIVSPEEVLEKHGRDSLRLYFLSLTPWNNIFFNWDAVSDAERMLNVFWNTFEYIKTYAPKVGVQHAGLQPEDEWIISKVNSLVEKTMHANEGQAHVLAKEASEFILQEFSRWYIKMVRDRLAPGYTGKDKASAQYALHYVMKRVLVLMAPVTPFITDKIYQELYSQEKSGKESVHMSDWPEYEKAKPEMEKQMETVKLIVENASAARAEAGIKLRWPVDKVTLDPFKGKEKEVGDAVKTFGNVLKKMCNCKEIIFEVLKTGAEFGSGKLSVGKPLMEEALLRDLTRKVQALRKDSGLVVGDKIELWISEKVPKENLAPAVGAKKINFGGMKEKKGFLKFEGKEIQIGFRKV